MVSIDIRTRLRHLSRKDDKRTDPALAGRKDTVLRLAVMSLAVGLTLAAALAVSAGCATIPPTDDGDQVATVDSVADTWYVSPAGDDTAGGHSTATAFQTVAKAIEAAGPGDTVLIAPGTYTEAARATGFGNASASITIRGDGDGVIFDGEHSRSAGFWCEACSNVVFERIEFRDYTDMGILVTLSDTVTLRQLTIRGNGFAATIDWVEGYGIHVDDSRNVTIEDNVVYENGPSPQIAGRWMGTGINLFNIADSTVRNNRSYDNIGGGLLVEDSVEVLVEGNELAGNELDATIEGWWDGAVWIDGGRDITLRNNTIRDNHGPGIEISDEDGKTPTGYVLEGNIVTGNLYGVYLWNFGTNDLPADDILSVTDDNDVSGNLIQDWWIEAQN